MLDISNKIHNLLSNITNSKIVICASERQDLDCICSSLMMREIMTLNNNHVEIYADFYIDSYHSFVPNVKKYMKSMRDINYDFSKFEYLIIVDGMNTGVIIKDYNKSKVTPKFPENIIIIDHHSNNEEITKNYACDTSAPSASFIIYNYANDYKLEVSSNFYTYALLGLLSDTESFRWNMETETVNQFQNIMQHNPDRNLIKEYFYKTLTFNEVKMFAKFIDILEYDSVNGIHYIFATKDFIESLNLQKDNLAAIKNYLSTFIQNIFDVNIYLYVTEQLNGVSWSLRSTEQSNFNCALASKTIASKYGGSGGGHIRAAGGPLLQNVNFEQFYGELVQFKNNNK